MYMENRWGARQNTWETPVLICLDILSSFLTWKLLFDKIDLMVETNWEGTSMEISLWIRPECQTSSKTFSTSRRIAIVFSLWFKLFTMSSTILINWVSWCDLSPCWSGQIFEIVWTFSPVSIRFSYSLDNVFNEEIGLWLIGLRTAFPEFGIMMIIQSFVANFHWVGKYFKRMHELKIRHM